MKKYFTKFLFLLLLLFCISPQHSQGQSLSTEGKDFWMGFTQNFGDPEALDLFITSRKATSGTVSIPLAGFTRNFNVTANGTVKITLPNNPAHSVGTGIKNNAVRIISQDTISVFAINNLTNSTDATVVLPRATLDIKPTYIVSSFLGGGSFSGYLIVGIDNNTPIRITNPNGTIQNITLNQGQTYQGQLTGETADVSNTIITTTDECKTFAVFSGVGCANIPSLTCTRCDHIFTQQYPTFTWGTEYLVTPFGAGRSGSFSLEQTGGYVIRIFREELNTTATVNGVAINWNGPQGRYHEINVLDFTTRCISASGAISVTQYMKGQECNGLPPQFDSNTLAKGDPSMLILNPNNQTVRSAVFNTVSTNNLSDHFVNVILKTEDIGCLTLDGATVNTSKFEPFPNCSEYSFARLNISNGSHVVECNNGFIAYCYGIGERESYAYTAGAGFENLQFRIAIEDEFNANTTSGPVESCTGVEIDFNAIGENALSYTWNFGDGSPEQNGSSVSHTYTNPGSFQITLTATVEDGCGTRDIVVNRTVNTLLYPNVDFGGDPTATFCTGGSVALDAGDFGENVTYSWSNGINTRLNTVSTPGTYTVTVSNNVGCSSTNSIVVNEIALPVLSFTGLANTYCIDAPSIDLLTAVSPSISSVSSFTIEGNSATTFDPAALGEGIYDVVFFYSDPTTGCDNQISKTVTVNTLPTVTFPNLPNTLCQNGASIDLFDFVSPSSSTQGSITVDGSALSTLAPSTLTVGQSYLIRYEYTEPSTGCSNAAEQSISIVAPPSPAFTGLENNYCLNFGNIDLYAQVSPSSTQTGVFQLNAQTPFTVAEAQDFNTNALIGGQTYALTYIYTDPSSECQNTVSTTFSITPLPVINFVNLAAQYCPSDVAFGLSDKVDRAGGTFTLDGEPATSIDPAALEPGQSYELTYTFTDPSTLCTNSITRTIGTPSLPVFVDLAPVYCQDGGSVTPNAEPSGGTFRLNGNIIATLDPALYAAGAYTLSYTDAGNCASIDTQIEILASTDPVIVVSASDICSDFGDEFPVIIDATEGISDPSRDVSYEWLNQTEEALTQRLSVSQSGSYTVRVLNNLNCTEERTFIVNERDDCEPRIFMPDAFSPNNDGLNDKLEVFGRYFVDYKLTIYNRWGEIIFQGFTAEDQWDGRMNGQDAPAGVYIVVLEYRLLTEDNIRRDSRKLTILR